MSALPISRFFRALGGNFYATLLMLAFRRSALRWLTATPAQFLLMLALSLTTSFCFDVISEGYPGVVQPEGFASYLLPPFFMTVFGAWLCQRYSAWRLGFAPVVAWLAADIMLGLVELLLQEGSVHNWWPAQVLEWRTWIYSALFFWPLAAVVTLFGRALGWRWWQDTLVAAGMAAVFFCWFLEFSELRMWSALPADDEADTPSLSEDVFYAQPDILAQALDGLQSGQPDRPNWYFVGVAGDSYQNVFRHEIDVARSLFDERFGTKGRSIELVNSEATALTLPMASRTSLERSLDAIAGKMDKQDVLFLYMSSHGSRDPAEFEVSNEPLQLDSITPAWLRQALDNAGIRRRVIVISACFSGGFIPALASPDTVVITAADARHTSFGCSDDAEFTYFGRAFINEAMRHQHGIKAAFAEASATVRQRERMEGFEPSNPQMVVGGDIAGDLPALDAALFGQAQ